MTDVKTPAKPSTALQGASRAFFKAGSPQQTLDTNPFKVFRSVDDSARHTFEGSIAATSCGLDADGRTSSGLSQWDLPNLSSHSPKDVKLRPSSRSSSPSKVAAHLTVSNATLPPGSEGLNSRDRADERASKNSMQNKDDTTDTTPVPATQTLVKLYEAKQGSKAPPKPTESIRYARKQPSDVASPKPVKPPALKTQPNHLLAATLPKALGLNSPGTTAKTSDPKNADAAPSPASVEAKVDQVASDVQRKPPLPPPPRRSQQAVVQSQEAIDTGAKSGRSNGHLSNISKAEAAAPPPPRRQSSKTGTPNAVQQPSTDTLVKSDTITKAPILPPRPPSNRPSPPRFGSSPTTSYQDTSIYQSYTPRLSVDSLANAMVASSLASSRASSPAKSVPPPPPHRKTSRSHLFHHHNSNSSTSSFHDDPGSSSSISIATSVAATNARNPSPIKAFRQTMRDAPKPEPNSPNHHLYHHHHQGKKNKWGRHPHKHHEGDRKRYRMELTERERKRYEGVWAANRGLLLPPPSPDPNGGGASRVTNFGGVRQDVVNIVVADIWRRSRLPDRVLKEIWDLVVEEEQEAQGGGKEGKDRLTREEFVVGMWLIDQMLKGNKLPGKVPESVWSSVRILSGIKVRR